MKAVNQSIGKLDSIELNVEKYQIRAPKHYFEDFVIGCKRALILQIVTIKSGLACYILVAA